jgi:hypothetical protein
MKKTQNLELPVAVTQTKAHPSTSNRYRFISTMDVVNLAEKFGWRVSKALEGKLRKSKTKGFNKHIVIMEKEKFKGAEGNIQLVIRNSHNGTSAIQIFLGYMRFVCSNQLYSKNLGQGMDLSVRHSDNGYHQLVEFLKQFDQAVDLFAEKIKKSQEKKLSPAQVKTLTKKALALRVDSEMITPELVDYVITPQRVEDAEQTAWNVMNRIQERFMSGGIFLYNPETGNKKTLRKIRAIDTQVKLNTQLMDLVLA